jgi:hypothetical protein
MDELTEEFDMTDVTEREPITAPEALAPLPTGTILRDEIGRVFIRTDAQRFHWRTIWGRGFDLTDQQATSYPVRVLFEPADA